MIVLLVMRWNYCTRDLGSTHSRYVLIVGELSYFLSFGGFQNKEGEECLRLLASKEKTCYRNDTVPFPVWRFRRCRLKPLYEGFEFENDKRLSRKGGS